MLKGILYSHMHIQLGDSGRRDETNTLLVPKKDEIELKSQQPCTVVLALLGLSSMAQLADELRVPA